MSCPFLNQSPEPREGTTPRSRAEALTAVAMNLPKGDLTGGGESLVFDRNDILGAFLDILDEGSPTPCFHSQAEIIEYADSLKKQLVS